MMFDLPVLTQGFNTVTATAWVIGLCCAWLIAWDYFVYRTPRRGDTISEISLRWGYLHPVIPFAAGVVCGHLFWPQVVYVSTVVAQAAEVYTLHALRVFAL